MRPEYRLRPTGRAPHLPVRSCRFQAEYGTGIPDYGQGLAYLFFGTSRRWSSGLCRQKPAYRNRL